MLYKSAQFLALLFLVISFFPLGSTAQRVEVEEIFYSSGLSPGTRSPRFNEDISVVGDLDGDGIRELVASYRGGSLVWIIFLNEEGRIRDYVEYDLDTFPELKVNADKDSRIGIGRSMTELDDLDQDGVPEILITMAGKDEGNVPGVGGLLVLFMNADGSFKRYQVIDTDEGDFDGELFPNVRNPAVPFGSSFGSSAAVLSDLDGDGIREIAVGAYSDSPLGGDANGAIFILFLNEEGKVKKHHKIGFETGDMGEFLLLTRSFFGADIAYMGDMNNDGLIEIAVSAVGGRTHNYEGAVYLFSLNEEGAVVHRQKFDYTNGYFIDHQAVGQGVDNVGDLNGDGIDELAVTAHQSFDSIETPVFFFYFDEQLAVQHVVSIETLATLSITTYHELRPQGEALIYMGGQRGIARYEKIDFPPSIDTLLVEEGPHTSSDSVTISVDFFDGDGDEVTAQLYWETGGVGPDSMLLNQVSASRFQGIIPPGPSSAWVEGNVQLMDQDSLLTIEEFSYIILPDTPDSLQAFLNDMQAVLSWKRSPGIDFSYQVYRAEGDGEFVSLNLHSYGFDRYTDRDVQPGNVYRYRVTAYNQSGESAPSNEVEVCFPASTSIDQNTTDSPNGISVDPGFPNPFSSSVAFRVKVDEVTDARIVVYDQLGRQVGQLFEGVLTPGSRRIIWQADDIAPGLYSARFQLNDRVVHKQVIKR